MTRQEAAHFARTELNKHGLIDWSVRLNQNADGHFLGLCSYRDKCIILNAHHIDIHPTPDVRNTILHEIGHALTPGHRHDDIWQAKASQIGCDNTSPCSNLSLSPDVIDAIRSGATVEVSFEEQIIRTPKYNITRLQDKCEYCGKVAKSLSEKTIPNTDETRPDLKIITLECGHTIVKKIPKGTPFHLLQFGGDANCKHDWFKNSCKICDRKRPYDFQIKGMQFIEAALAVNNGGACFDEMGLGKTIQAGGVIKFHPELWPTLWIVKSALKYQFAVFLIQWLGDEHVPQMVETSKDFLIPGLKHYIIGYDMLVPKIKTMKKSGKTITSGFDIAQFDRIGIKCVVLDECQQIKNVDSSRTQMVRRVVKGRKVIPLSGTPWKNRGSELFPVFNMMDPIKFHSEEGFRQQWVEYYWHGNVRKEGGIRNIKRFKEHTKDLCIRRERTEVLPELPTVNRTKLYVRMDPNTEAMYDEAVSQFVEWYQSQAENISGMHLLAAMAKMRHLVGLAKIPATLEYVDEFVEDTDRKIVVFVHHIDVADTLMDEFTVRYGNEIPVMHITGGMDGYTRNNLVEKFNNSPRAIMVASTLSSGEGLNLQTGSDCVIHERQFNPANEEQVESRFVRIGAAASIEAGGSGMVNAVYTHMEGLTAIDSTLDGINEGKRIRFHNLMNASEMPQWNQDSFAKELADAIVAGHNRKKLQKAG
jgi:superfamily II DNA or RNA helicase